MNFDGSTLISHPPSTNSNNGNNNTTFPTVQLLLNEQSLTLGMSLKNSNRPDFMAYKSSANPHSAAALSSSLPIFPGFDRPVKSRPRPNSQNFTKKTSSLSIFANQHLNASSPSLIGGNYNHSSSTSMQTSYVSTPQGLSYVGNSTLQQQQSEFSQDEGQRHASFHNDGQLLEDTKPIFTHDCAQHPVFTHTVSEDTSFSPDTSHTIFSQASQDASPYDEATNSSFQQGTTHQTGLQYLQHPREHKRRSSPAALENSYKLPDTQSVMTTPEQNMSTEDLTGINQQEAAMLLANNFNHPLNRKDINTAHRMSWDYEASPAHPLQRHATSMQANPQYNNSIRPSLHSHSGLHTNGLYANQADIRRHSFDVSWKQGPRHSPQPQLDIKPIFNGFDNPVYEPPTITSSAEISSLPSVMEPSSGPQYRSIDDFFNLDNSTINNTGRRLTWTQSSGSVPGVHDGVNSSGIMDTALYAQQFPRDPYTPHRYSLPASAPVSIARPTSTQQKRKSALLDENFPDMTFDDDFLNMNHPSLQGTQPPPSPTDSLFRKRTKSLDMTDTYCDEADMGDLSMEDGAIDMNSDCPAFPDMSAEELEALNNDPEAKPRRQRLRYVGDKYTPQWVRYQGQLKEGYCDLCRPGKWLQLKNSAYWYHKQFYHGISSVSGKEFEPPVEQRWADNELFEGLCHQCKTWVPVQNSKRKNSVLWYRHAHKCHVYHKPRAQQNHISKKR